MTTPPITNRTPQTGVLVASDNTTYDLRTLLTSGDVKATVENVVKYEVVSSVTYQLKLQYCVLADSATLQTLTLPESGVVGSIVCIVGVGSGLFRIAQNDGDQIIFGDQSTAIGVSGYVESTSQNDSITLVLSEVDGNNKWVVKGNAFGNFSIDGTVFNNTINNKSYELTLSSGFTVDSISNSPSATLASELMTANAVQIAISNGVMGLGGYRGFWDASSNLFPTTGGSGPSGAVAAADFWRISVSGTLGGTPVEPGDLIFAKVDVPGQDANNWEIEIARVHTVFGRTGEVLATAGDYNFPKIDGTCAVNQGGTGLTSSGADGNILVSAGGGWQSQPPSFEGAGDSYGTIYLSDGATRDEPVTTTPVEFDSPDGDSYTLLAGSLDFILQGTGRLQYTGSVDKLFQVTASTSYTSINNTNVSLYVQIYKNGVAVGFPSFSTVSNTTTANVVLSQNDYLSIFISRQSGSGNLTFRGFSLSATSLSNV